MSVHVSPVCAECPGRCCSRRTLAFDTLRLTPREAEMPRFEPHVHWRYPPGEPDADMYPVMTIDPACPFLGKDKRCSIYRHRPATCRNYVCHNDPMMMGFLAKGYYPTHKKLLSKWKVLPGQKHGIKI